jgi:regulator of RNase E activity RraA
MDIDGGIRQMGHRPVVGPRIVREFPRLPEALVERFRTVYLPDVSDAVGHLYTLDPSIRPLYRPMKRLVGLALTVKAPPGDNFTIHGALNMARAGDVLVVDWRGYTDGCGTGAASLMPAISRGLAGVVVDGGWRDIAELQAVDFPIFGKSIAAFSPPKSRPGEINVPVCCGGVIVHAGDLIVADEEGAVVVPRDYASVVADALSEYSPPTSLQDWDVERLSRSEADRRRYYEAVFEARGGSYVEWPGSGGPSVSPGTGSS